MTLRYGKDEAGSLTKRAGPVRDTNRDSTPPVDPAQRFRIFRLCQCQACGGVGRRVQDGRTVVNRCPDCRGEGSTLEEVAACGTPEAVGVALYTLALEDEFDGCPVGLLDSMGEPGRKWLIRPWLPSPRNVTDAARLLGKQPKRTIPQQ